MSTPTRAGFVALVFLPIAAFWDSGTRWDQLEQPSIQPSMSRHSRRVRGAIVRTGHVKRRNGLLLVRLGQ
jgi:hypothetical protein